MNQELKVAMIFARELYSGTSIFDGAMNIIMQAQEHKSKIETLQSSVFKFTKEIN